MIVNRLFAIAVFFAALTAPLRSQQAGPIEYMIDDSVGAIALYPAGGYRSYVEPKYMVPSLEELERRVGQLPPGTKLHWVPYKWGPSGKLILFSDGQYDQFAKFCREHDVELLISSRGIVQHKSQEPRQPLFVVRERVHPLLGSLECSQGRVVYSLSYSVITVFTDGEGTRTVWRVPPCSDPARAMGWTAPADSNIRNFSLSQRALDQLRKFLDRPEVERLRDFLNAGPGVGDYDIEIHRASEVQQIPVVSLMPEHDELKRDPTLLRVICKAKEIAGDERPTWCPN